MILYLYVFVFVVFSLVRSTQEGKYYLADQGEAEGDCITETHPCSSLEQILTEAGKVETDSVLVVLLPGLFTEFAISAQPTMSTSLEGPEYDGINEDSIAYLSAGENSKPTIAIQPASQKAISLSLHHLVWVLSSDTTAVRQTSLVSLSQNDGSGSNAFLILNDVLFYMDDSPLQIQAPLLSLDGGSVQIESVTCLNIASLSEGSFIKAVAQSTSDKYQLNDCYFEECSAAKGGALYFKLKSSTQITMKDVVFEQCVTSFAGHCMFIESSDAVLGELQNVLAEFRTNSLYSGLDFIGAVDPANTATYRDLLGLTETDGVYRIDPKRGIDSDSCGNSVTDGCKTLLRGLTNARTAGVSTILAAPGDYAPLTESVTLTGKMTIEGIASLSYSSFQVAAVQGATAGFVIQQDGSKIAFKNSIMSLISETTTSGGVTQDSTLTYPLFLVQDGAVLELEDLLVTASETTSVESTATPLASYVIQATEGRLSLKSTIFFSITLKNSPLLLVNPNQDAFMMTDECGFLNIVRQSGSGSVFSFTEEDNVLLTLSSAVFLNCECKDGYGGVLHISLPQDPTFYILFNDIFISSCSAKDNKGTFLAMSVQDDSPFKSGDWVNTLFSPESSQSEEDKYWAFIGSEDDCSLLEFKTPDPLYLGYLVDKTEAKGTFSLPYPTLDDAFASELFKTQKNIQTAALTIPGPTNPVTFIDSDVSIIGVGSEVSGSCSEFLFTSVGTDSIFTIGGSTKDSQLYLGSFYCRFTPKGKEEMEMTLEGPLVNVNKRGSLVLNSIVVAGGSNVLLQASLIVTEEGFITLSDTTFKDMTLETSPLVSIVASSQFEMEGNIWFCRIRRRTGDGSVFSLSITNEYPELSFSHATFDSCSSNGRGGAIYISVTQQPSSLDFGDLRFTNPETNTVASFVFVEYVPALWNTAANMKDAWLGLCTYTTNANGLFAIGCGDDIMQMYQFGSMVYTSADVSDATLGNGGCGDAADPCTSLAAAFAVARADDTIFLQDGLHASPAAGITTTHNTCIAGKSDDKSITVLRISSLASGSTQYTASAGTLEFVRLTIELVSTKEAPLAGVCFKGLEGASLEMRNVAILGDTEDAPLKESIINSVESDLRLLSVTFTGIATDSVPLLTINPLHVYFLTDLVFSGITRESGNGTILALDMSESDLSLSLSDWTMKDCSAKDGCGGAISVIMGEETSLDIGSKTKYADDGTLVYSVSFTGCDATYGGAVALTIPPNYVGTVTFDASSKGCSASKNGTDLYVQCLDAYASSSFASIVRDHTRQHNQFTYGYKADSPDADTILNLYDGIPETIRVASAAAGSARCGGSESPCASLAEALTTYGGSGSSITMAKGTYSSPFEQLVLKGTIQITGETETVQEVEDFGDTVFVFNPFSIVTIQGPTFLIAGNEQFTSQIFMVRKNAKLTLLSVTVKSSPPKDSENGIILSHSILSSRGGVVTLASSTFKDITMASFPLLDVEPTLFKIAASTDIPTLFHNIQRLEGNGSVIDWTTEEGEGIQLSGAKFINCRAPRGLGGSIFIELLGTPSAFELENLQFSFEGESTDDVAFYGNYIYILTDLYDFFWDHSEMLNNLAALSENGDLEIIVATSFKESIPEVYKRADSIPEEDDDSFPIWAYVLIIVGSVLVVVVVVLLILCLCNPCGKSLKDYLSE